MVTVRISAMDRQQWILLALVITLIAQGAMLFSDNEFPAGNAILFAVLFFAAAYMALVLLKRK